MLYKLFHIFVNFYFLFCCGLAIMKEIKENRRKPSKTGRIHTMISHGKEIKVFSGNSNPVLAAAVCQLVGGKLGGIKAAQFADRRSRQDRNTRAYTHRS